MSGSCEDRRVTGRPTVGGGRPAPSGVISGEAAAPRRPVREWFRATELVGGVGRGNEARPGHGDLSGMVSGHDRGNE